MLSLAQPSNGLPGSAAGVSDTLAGVFLVCLVLLLLVKCLQVAKRPTASAKCLASLMCALGVWLLPGITTVLHRWLHDPLLHGVVMAVCSLVTLACLAASVGLGIWGLIEYHSLPRRYTQGGWQAVTALCLCLVMGGLVVAGMVRAQYRNWGGARLPPGATAQPAGEVAFDKFNFRFRRQARPWVEVDAKRLNPDATFAMMRRQPYALFVIIAEAPGAEAELDNERLVEVCKANLRSAATNVRLGAERPERVAGVDGIRFDSELELVGRRLYGVHWVATCRGYAYQLLTRGSLADREFVRREAARLHGSFALIDPQRTAPSHGPRLPDRFASPYFGYAVNLAGAQWRAWMQLDHDWPDAEFGVLGENRLSFVVVPVALGDFAPHQEALMHALLARTGVKYPGGPVTDIEAVKLGRMEGQAFSYESQQGSEQWVFRGRVLQAKGFACLGLAALRKAYFKDKSQLDQTLDRVEFTDPPPPQPAPELLSARARHTHGLVFNELGLHYFGARQLERARACLEQAVYWEPTNHVIVGNLLDALTQLKEVDAGLAAVEKHRALVEQWPELQAHRATFQAQAGRWEEARRGFSDLFAKGYQNEDQFGHFINLLAGRGEIDEALRQVDGALQRRDSLRVRLLQATLLRQKKDFEPALRILEEQQKKLGFNAEVALALIETRLAAERASEALRTCEQLIERGYDDATAYVLKARAEYALKSFPQAKASLEVAAKKNPADGEIKSFLDHVSGMLGEGSNSAIKEFIAPVPVPERLRAGWPPGLPASALREYGAQYLEWTTAIAYEQGKELRTTDIVRIEVVDASGVSKFSTLEFPFDPFGEEVYVNRLVVRDSVGGIVSTGAPANYYVVDEPGRGVATQRKSLHLPVAGLQPGHRIEATVTRRELGKPAGFPFRKEMLFKWVPVARRLVFVRGDAQGLRHESLPPQAPQRSSEGIWWQTDQPPPFRWEPLQPSWESFEPMLWLGDPKASWAGEATNYLASLGERLKPDAGVRALALAQVADLQSPTQKVARLVRCVQEHCTYKAIEFGRRARVPNSPGQTLQNRYGDCKDQSLLLQQLLAAAGLEAHLALVNAHHPIRHGLPSLDQFNHMLVYVPLKDGDRFADCADQGADLALPAPAALGGQTALILDPERPRLVELPEAPPGSGRIVVRREVRIVNEADAEMREEVQFTGPQGAGLRATLQALDSATRKLFIQRELLGSSQSLSIEDLSLENLEAAGGALTLKLASKARGQFQAAGGQMVGSLPAGWEHAMLRVESLPDRRTPFQLRLPMVLQTTVTLTTPAGYAVPAADAFSRRVTGRFGAGQMSARPAARGLQIEGQWEQITGRFTPADYARYEKDANQALQLFQPTVVFRKSGK